MKQPFNIGSGIFDKEAMTFTMGNKVYQVKEKSEKIRYKEREDAGGGAYYQNKVWAETIRTTHFVWNDGEYIGEIVSGSSVKFKDPKRHQIKIKPKNNNQCPNE